MILGVAESLTSTFLGAVVVAGGCRSAYCLTRRLAVRPAASPRHAGVRGHVRC